MAVVVFVRELLGPNRDLPAQQLWVENPPLAEATFQLRGFSGKSRRIRVEDYETFRHVFDSAADMRQDAAGALGNTVYQSVDNPNEVTVRVEFPTVDAAKDYSTSQGLREAMQRAGLQGTPTIWFVNEV